MIWPTMAAEPEAKESTLAIRSTRAPRHRPANWMPDKTGQRPALGNGPLMESLFVYMNSTLSVSVGLHQRPLQMMESGRPMTAIGSRCTPG